jgi:signal transduction histidine kinase
MDLRQMVRIIRDQVPALTSARDLYLALYDAATGEITFPLAVRDGQPFEIPPRQLGSDEVSYVIRNRRLLMLGGENPRPEDMRRNMGITEAEVGISRYLGVPLAAGDMVAGVLAVRDTDINRPFGLNDQRIMTTIGAQLGAMIQNSNLFARVQNFANELNERVEERTAELQQERDRLGALYRITSELGRTLDMNAVLNGALDMVSDAIGAEEGVVLLLDQTHRQLYARAIRQPDGTVVSGEVGGIDQEYADRRHHPSVMVGDWLMEQTERAALIENLKKQKFWNSRAPDAKRWSSALAVALESEGDPLGAMVFFSSKPGAFTEPQLRLVSTAAGQVSSAVKNADLYALVTQQADQMSTMLQSEREEAEKNSAILEGIADGVLLADSSGTIVLFNAAAERILETPRDLAIGQRLDRLRSNGVVPAWVNAISGYVLNPPRGSADQPGEDFVVDRLESGRRIVNIRSSPVYNADQFLGTVSLFRDVTRDVEVDRMKSEFISNVSHELRTPMTSIKGYADLLLMGGGGDVSPDQQRFLQTIKSNADRLAELVNDLLNISKIDAGSEQLTLGRVDVRDVIDQTVAYHRSRVEFQRKNLSIRFEPDADLPPILADRIKVAQIFSNIIDNAFSYTYPNGHIDIRARVDRARDGVLVTVRDDGIGIPESFRPRIWNRFERYDAHALVLEVAGTGLGLSIVRHLVDLHHGEVWVESEEGKGSTFSILLPIEGPDAGLRGGDQQTVLTAIPQPAG